MIYFTADHHFKHRNIIRYTNRPFKNVSEMDRKLVVIHNDTVSKDDEVYFLGDLTMLGPSHKQNVEKIVSSLNGKKHLILGNHDRLKPFDYVEIGFLSVHTALKLQTEKMGEIILTHDPNTACMFPKNVVFCGHIHNLFRVVKNVVNVGVDVWNYGPVSMTTIEELYKNGFFKLEGENV